LFFHSQFDWHVSFLIFFGKSGLVRLKSLFNLLAFRLPVLVPQMEHLTKAKFTHLNKLLYPQLQVTKHQFIEYVIKMAPRMLPFLRDRPLVVTRYPEGVTAQGFYAKNVPEGAPSWVQTVNLYSKSAKRDTNYIVCNDFDTLLWLANLDALEIHIPLSSVDSLETPDFAFFDIDPEPPATFQDAASAALLLHEKLEELGLVAYVKTSGKKGLHVLLPVVGTYSFSQTRNLVHALGKLLAKDSDLIVSEFSDTKKPAKVFIDYVQNGEGRTLICPYSLRVTPEATASAPVEWAELKKGIKPADFTIFSVPLLKTDPWKDIFSHPQKLEVY
jgi:bifunctional non-homologous end joining protein LigD